MKTNIGRIFLRLLEKHSPKHHKYCKLCNRNTINITCSCLQDMTSAIQNHYTNLLKDPAAVTAKECSFWQKSNCPLAEKFLSGSLVYHAEVDRSDMNQIKNCYGTCKKNFKEHYSSHTTSFRNKSKGKKEQQNSESISGRWKMMKWWP